MFVEGNDNMKLSRREWIIGASLLALGTSLSFSDQDNTASPLDNEPGTQRFRSAQERALAKYRVQAQSRFVSLSKPALKVHVLAAGRGDPVVLIHGGGTAAVTQALLLSALAESFECFAPDRPGCGLTDRFDYTHVPFRQHAVDFVTSLLDALKLPKAALAGNSMGGYWAIVFALAAPERVTKLVLVGGPVGSAPPPPHPRPPRPPEGDASLDVTRARFRVLMADANRAPVEILEADYAASKLPGASRAWNSMVEDCTRERISTYALRPELKNLRPPTLFIYGDKDMEGPPSLAREMAELTPNGRCEIVADAGHLVWLDQPRVCTKLILDFLRST
jgi:pimeloyl-ACP methyl ester carboxylesterase